jgi:hypothetical protein
MVASFEAMVEEVDKANELVVVVLIVAASITNTALSFAACHWSKPCARSPSFLMPMDQNKKDAEDEARSGFSMDQIARCALSLPEDRRFCLADENQLTACSCGKETLTLMRVAL